MGAAAGSCEEDDEEPLGAWDGWACGGCCAELLLRSSRDISHSRFQQISEDRGLERRRGRQMPRLIEETDPSRIGMAVRR